MLFRCLEKAFLDSTGWVQLRHACNAGGAYYCFNALSMHISCFVAAALYSAYSTGIPVDHASFRAAGENDTRATNITATGTGTFPANGTVAGHAGKIDNFTLFLTIGTLSAVWIIAFAGLLLTMKREYVGTLVSQQTGHAFARSHFLDHPGDDARRILIFYCNQWQWRSIRELVRQWVLGVHTTWVLLRPAWLTDALRAVIPDDFMPAPVVQQLDAQAPGGRRPSIANMGALRRISLAFAGAEDTAQSSGCSS